MTITLTSLLRTRSRDEVRDGLLKALTDAGFPVTSWRSGGLARTLVEVTAAGLTDAWALAGAIAQGALLELSTDDWLTALARSAFDVERAPATFALGYVHLVAASGIGPYSIAAGALVVSDGTRFYRSTNTTTLTVTVGGTLDVPVRAEGSGAVYNTPTLNVLVSPALPGVTLTSPIWGGGSTWRTTDARDEETDASLRQRCRDRWSTLGRGATAAAYRYLVTSCPAAPGVTRAAVVLGPGDGTLRVYLATSSGPASPSEVTAVESYLSTRAPATDAPTVLSATAVPVNVSMTVRTRDTSAENRTRILDALDVLQRALDLGQRLDVGALYAAAYTARDVVDVTLSSPSADVTVPPEGIAVMTPTVSLVSA